MADYLIQDSTLTDIADAIRAKDGSSAPIMTEDMASAIAAIPSGGEPSDTLVIKGVTGFFVGATGAGVTKIRVESSYLKNGAIALLPVDETNGQTPRAIEEIEFAEGIHAPDGITVQLRAAVVRQPYALRKVNFNCVPIFNFYQAFTMLYGAAYNVLESVLGLNFEKVGGANYRVGACFSGAGSLKNVTVKANSLGQLDLIDQTKNWFECKDSPLLTDDSLISIANGLCADHTSKIIFHATSKTRLSQIVGSVSSVTDDMGTYDFFTAAPDGTVTLMDFITNTKGWTVT